jgi:hypothetical protein
LFSFRHRINQSSVKDSVREELWRYARVSYLLLRESCKVHTERGVGTTINVEIVLRFLQEKKE